MRNKKIPVLLLALVTVLFVFLFPSKATAVYTPYMIYENEYVIGISDMTTAGEFFSLHGGIIRGNDGVAKADDELIITGDTVDAKYVAVVCGDVDGTGTVTGTDYLMIIRSFNRTYSISGANFIAADIDLNGIINSSDYIMIKRHFLKTFILEQSLDDTQPVSTEKPQVPTTAGANTTVPTATQTEKPHITTATQTEKPHITTTTQTEKPHITASEPDVTETTYPSDKYEPLNYTNMKAIWISQYDISSVYQLTREATYQTRIDAVMKDCVDKGFNTVIVQVRPNGDSFYPSEYYPWSSYVTGSYSTTASKSFDPLKILIEKAHGYKLSVQAWINPMRLMSTSQITSINSKYLIRQWYDNTSTRGKYIVAVDGRYYLNPAYEEVRSLIIDGAVEICENYNIDGIHMDDYFYPTTESSFDSSAFATSSSSRLSTFRKNNLNLLVSGMYKQIKAYDKRVLFGISPAGDIDTVESSLYAEVSKWGSTAGYVDYLMPQIYWGFNNTYAPFITRIRQWSNLVTNGNVKLYIGLALYKAADSSARTTEDGTEWANNKDILKREIEYLTASAPKCAGVAVFSYKYMSSSEYPTGAAETLNMLNALKVAFN